MPFSIIDLEARGLLPLHTLPFCREPMKITVMDRAGQEFEARALHDEITIKQLQGTSVESQIIGWKMRA